MNSATARRSQIKGEEGWEKPLRRFKKKTKDSLCCCGHSSKGVFKAGKKRRPLIRLSEERRREPQDCLVQRERIGWDREQTTEERGGEKKTRSKTKIPKMRIMGGALIRKIKVRKGRRSRGYRAGVVEKKEKGGTEGGRRKRRIASFMMKAALPEKRKRRRRTSTNPRPSLCRGPK